MGKFTIFFFLAAFLPAVFGFMPTPVLPQSTRTFTRNAAMTMNSGADLIETARREGCFNTFLKARDDIGMTNDLKSGIYTVYMPTDSAFQTKAQCKEDVFVLLSKLILLEESKLLNSIVEKLLAKKLILKLPMVLFTVLMEF